MTMGPKFDQSAEELRHLEANRITQVPRYDRDKNHRHSRDDLLIEELADFWGSIDRFDYPKT